jgi:hypothetical protein
MAIEQCPFGKSSILRQAQGFPAPGPASCVLVARFPAPPRLLLMRQDPGCCARDFPLVAPPAHAPRARPLLTWFPAPPRLLLMCQDPVGHHIVAPPLPRPDQTRNHHLNHQQPSGKSEWQIPVVAQAATFQIGCISSSCPGSLVREAMSSVGFFLTMDWEASCHWVYLKTEPTKNTRNPSMVCSAVALNVLNVVFWMNVCIFYFLPSALNDNKMLIILNC